MEPLYQESPRKMSRNPNLVPPSYTESIESYMRAARIECWIHENNYRFPKHEIVLHMLKKIDVVTIKLNWKKLRKRLNKAGIEFAAAIEITRGKDRKPSNRIHYHFLIDSPMDRDELKQAIKTACIKSGIGAYQVDFTLNCPSQADIVWGITKIHYFTKFNKPEKVILFKKGFRIQKFYYSRNWFIEPDGTPTTKTKIRERLIKNFKQLKGIPPVPQNNPIPYVEFTSEHLGQNQS